MFLVAANGRFIINEGEVDVTFQLGDKAFTRTFVIVEGLGHSLIVGWDSITALDFILNGKDCTLQVGDNIIPLEIDENVSSLVRLTESVNLAPQSQTFCHARRARTTCHEDGEYACFPAQFGVLAGEPGLMMACTLNYVKKGKTFPIMLVNNTNRTFALKKGNVVGKLEKITDETIENISEICSETNYKSPPADPNQHPQQIRNEQVGSSKVPFKVPSTLEELLENNSDLFAESDLDLGRTNMTEMTIETNTQEPVCLPPYRAPLAKRDFIESKVDEMLQAGIISQSRSPWSAPVVIVQKKDGTQRFCVDYRRLNEVTQRYNFPLPVIDDLLASLHGSKYFSTLDLRSGYHQIPMAEDSKAKTAFVCHRGVFEFNVMSFGLCNAPSVFSEMMAKVLKGVTFATSYLDDVVVYSRTSEEHLSNLQVVFDRLRAAGLKLKRKKCEFFKEQLEFLGHMISEKGIQPCKDKVEVIVNLEPPKTLKEVRSFIGMTGFYRRYIPNYSKIAKPLSALTRKNAQFLWTPECQESFEKLKESLVTQPILALPDMTKPFVVYTDASDVAIGAVLLQEHEDGPKAIHYVSHLLTPTQTRWPIIEREAFAIVSAVRKFHPYLYGSEFVVRTDHKPLEYLFKSPQKNIKIQKYAMELSEANCKIEYITGAKNVQADFLSRIKPTEVSVINTDKIKLPAKQTETGSDMSEETENSPIQLLQNGEPLNMEQEQLKDKKLSKLKGDSRYTKIEGVLYYIAEEPNMGLKLVIPKHLKELVLQENHDNLGHMGIDKTYDRIRAQYHWKGIYRDVVQHVSHCVPCNTRNLKQQHAPMQEMDEVSRPFQKLAIDFCGPFPTSHQGNKYLLTFCDQYSGWPEFFAVPDKSAQTVADIILSEIIPRHGCPQVLLSDNGTEFTNRIVSGICQRFNIYRIKTSPYHPQSNGKLERMHKVFNDLVAKNTSDTRAWENMIPSALLAIRTSNHESTKFSPFYLMTGRDPLLPLDTLLVPRARYYGEDHHEHILQRHHKAMVAVQHNQQKARERTKRYHDRKAKEPDFEVDDPVYVYKHHRTSKLEPRWEPYYRIVEKLTAVNFVVCNMLTGSLKRVHAMHLRKANLDWEIPNQKENDRPPRKAKLAARVSSDSDQTSRGSDIDMVQEQPTVNQSERSFSTSDYLPLSRLRHQQRYTHLPNVHSSLKSELMLSCIVTVALGVICQMHCSRFATLLHQCNATRMQSFIATPPLSCIATPKTYSENIAIYLSLILY